MTSVSESDQERESNMSLTLGDIKAAAARILGKVHMTEVRTCDTINKMTGDKELFFKEFAAAFQKLEELGTKNLKTVALA